MPDGFDAAVQLLPQSVRDAASALPRELRSRAEEIRLRTGNPVTLRLPEGERPLPGGTVTPQLLTAVLEAATRASYHAAGQQLRQGYLSAPGGVRVGVCGTGVSDGALRTLREISSLCIRIPHQIPSAGKEVIPLIGNDSVLIISPPGGGKTTFLRELVRTVSDGGTRVSLADERGEIAAVCSGEPQFRVGRCTDVLTGVPKAEAAMLLLRAMGPEVVAMDEISAPEDAIAVETLLGCGVRVFATAHGASRAELLRRPVYARLQALGAFQKIVCISGGTVRHYTVESL